jgi:hypothetical protein
MNSGLRARSRQIILQLAHLMGSTFPAPPPNNFLAEERGRNSHATFLGLADVQVCNSILLTTWGSGWSLVSPIIHFLLPHLNPSPAS